MKKISCYLLLAGSIVWSFSSCSTAKLQQKNTTIKVVIIPNDSVVTLMGRNIPATNIWAVGH